MTAKKVADGHVMTRRVGRVGHLILNRPESINALTRDMVDALAAALDDWAVDPRVRTVVLTGSGTRGLCAGGDVVAMSSDDGSPRASTALFLGPEYRLNATIAAFPKPFVAIMDGIVLGGGVGLSSHGSHRVVTERSKIGMPETAIGLIPDVGSTWLLTRSAGHRGTHLALTGSIIESRSPSAVLAAFEAMARARLMPHLVEALNQEYRVMLHLAAAPDFIEGVRAQIVEKDHTPRWNPRSIEQVNPDAVLAKFSPLKGYPDLFSDDGLTS
jgi:enoyl-CoA hydratase